MAALAPERVSVIMTRRLLVLEALVQIQRSFHAGREPKEHLLGPLAEWLGYRSERLADDSTTAFAEIGLRTWLERMDLPPLLSHDLVRDQRV